MKDTGESILVTTTQSYPESFRDRPRPRWLCSSCGYVKHKYEPFMYFSLGIPKRHRVTLEDCLEMFCSQEELVGSEMWYCKKCKRLVEAKKQCEIVRIAEVSDYSSEKIGGKA